MSNLKTTLENLSAEFAANVLRAIRGASLEDLISESGTGRAPAKAPARAARPAPKAEKAAPAAAPAPAAAAPAKGGKKGSSRRRLARRSPADIAAVVDQIVALLSKKPEGLRSEDIRRELGLAANEMPRPLADGLAAKRLTKEGAKRATVYFAKGAGGGKKK